MAESYEEWRLLANVHDGGTVLERVVEDVRAQTEEDVEVHRRDSNVIAVYAFTQDAARRTEQQLTAALRREGLTAEMRLTRWNPGLERWQDPSLPVDPAPTPLASEWTELGELAWEVRVTSVDRAEARRIEQELRNEGRPTRNDGRKRFAVGVADQAAATAVAEQIKLSAPFAKVEVRRLSRFRRWLIRQAAAGNYAEGGFVADGGGFVNGGGGG